MSFFVRNVKNKIQKLNEKKAVIPSESKSVKNNKRPNISVKPNFGKKFKKNESEDEHYEDDDDEDELINSNDESLDFDEDEDDINTETAQEKKLRLAKQYLEDVEKEQKYLEESDERAIGVSNQLREDILEKSGKLKKLVAKNYTNGVLLKELKGHQLPTTCVVISNDSKFIFSGSKDGSIVKWDTETGKKLFVIKKKLVISDKSKQPDAHSDQIYCLALTTDFKFLASGGVDKNIIVWDPVTCNHIYTFYGHRDAVSGLSFRQNTHQLYSSSFDRSVKLWSVDEMTYIETLYGHQDKILSIDSLNKERCVTCGARDRSIRVWKIVEESQLIFQGTNFDSIDCLCLVNDDHVLSGSNDGALSLWHVSKKKPLYTAYKAHRNDDNSSTWISSVAALHNTDLIASGSNDGYVRVWACAENFFKFEEIFKIKINGFINDLKFSNDGQYLIAAVGQEHKLGRWSRIKESKNSIAIIKFEKNINDKKK